MNAHLNEQQFGELILGTRDQEIAGHIEACDVCAIKQRLTRHHFAPYVRWVAMAAMVLVVSAAFLLTRTPQPVQQANNDAADDVLLQQVQSDIERDYPAALAPAVLIDEERNSALSASAKRSSNQ